MGDVLGYLVNVTDSTSGLCNSAARIGADNPIVAKFFADSIIGSAIKILAAVKNLRIAYRQYLKTLDEQGITYDANKPVKPRRESSGRR